MSASVLSCFSHVWLFVTLWTVARQAPLSIGFSRQEYWSGLLCPPPGDLSDPGIGSASLRSPALAGRFFTTSTTWEAQVPLITWEIPRISGVLCQEWHQDWICISYCQSQCHSKVSNSYGCLEAHLSEIMHVKCLTKCLAPHHSRNASWILASCSPITLPLTKLTK